MRVALFWAPLVLVFSLLLRSGWFRNLPVLKRALLGSLAAISALWTTAYFTATWQLKALPSDGEIEELGGRRFIRPSDRKFMEYWLSGDIGSKTAVIFCHRMDGKCGAIYGRTKVEAVLKDKGVVLVSPSMPSLSASPPYDTMSATQWLNQWSQDMMFLLEDLGVEHVYVLGLSWGAQPCLNLAMACQKKGMLRGIAQIGGNYWNTRRVDYPYDSKWVEIFTKPTIMRPLAYLMMRPFISKMGDLSSMMPEKEIETMSKHFGEDFSLFGPLVVRSMTYFLHQNWQVPMLGIGSRDADEYVELSKFDPSIPIHVCLGTDDNVVGPQQQPFLDQIKHAELKQFEGSHTGFPLDEIIASIMVAKKM
jgi:pimeloyl-ACP methyl ester carboxylesterase